MGLFSENRQDEIVGSSCIEDEYLVATASTSSSSTDVPVGYYKSPEGLINVF